MVNTSISSKKREALLKGKKMHFEDGGLVSNDPSLTAWIEANRLFNTENMKNPILLVSIGTGIDAFASKNAPKGYIKLAMRSASV